MADEFNPIPRGSFDAPSDPLTPAGFVPPAATVPPAAQVPPAYAPPAGYVPPAYYAASPPPAFGYGAPAFGYPPPPPPRGRSGWFWFGIIGGIVVLLCVALGFAVHSISKSITNDADSDTSTFSSSTIAVIDISGVILDADKVDKQLKKFGDDSNVKAIVLHIDSPGGGAAASQEIYHEVLRVRQEKKKLVVASVESVGASGAYYIASACDKIWANPASVVGSIGVIMEWTNYGELMRWAKLKNVTITSGELKDAGDPTRDMTPKEQAYFQSLVNNMFGQFVHDVAVGRHKSDDQIKTLATGEVWTGEQAQGLGLIDAQGGFRDALMDTAKNAGVSGEPKIVRPSKEHRGLFATIDDADSLLQNPSKLLDKAPGFYFMWK